MSGVLADPLSPDHVSWVAPFGVTFCDALTLAPIKMGLDVTVTLLAEPELVSKAHANSSGVFMLHRLPGMPGRLAGSGDADFWRQPMPTRDYLIEVSDRMGRFLPQRFPARLPQKGLFMPDCLQPSPPAGRAIPLYPSPVRPKPYPLAVLRAQLRDALSDSPAAWAVVEARYRGEAIGRGVADANGALQLMFAYPEPERPPVLSPPASPPGGTPMFSWSVELAVRYDASLAAATAPECGAMLGQRAAVPLATFSPLAALGAITVEFGRERVLATGGTSWLYLQRT